MAKLAYVATVQITIHPNEKVETFAEACDWMSGLFSEQLENDGKIVGWHYLKVGDQYLYPTEQAIELEDENAY